MKLHVDKETDALYLEYPVFRRAEYAAAVGRQPGDKVVTAMLAQHLKAGNIQRIAGETGYQPGTVEKVLRLLDLVVEINRTRILPDASSS